MTKTLLLVNTFANLQLVNTHYNRGNTAQRGEKSEKSCSIKLAQVYKTFFL